MINPDQQKINEDQWHNQDNWSGPFYSSKKDDRLWVPKRNPVFGWTINFGHKYGLLTMIMISIVPLIAVAVGLTAVLSTRH
ncbi:MAG: hypothetical protein KGJ09_03410 [Candidatus Omnitrophica bacterium]|nr:hypothetical protein [Candidatus Omnitrophota bacterium]MDE2009106.1 hypothetical protein [Candidatus Omnitrophota bacterium]MDE2214229.1 hypothetical protein [Candidatus Omnitrophota bacterium]MDE2231266.1 hypothetical protein [Candidatus Omnitrophota bacterium]